MCGGGGDTTNVTETGLSETQQEEIVGNQAEIQSSVDGVGTSVNDGFATTQNNFDAQGDAIADVTKDVNSASARNTVNIMNQSQNQYEDTTAGISDLNTNINDTAATTNTAIGNLSNTVDTRADELTGTIDTRTGELSTQIDTRLDATDQGINEGFNTTNANLGLVYDGLGNQAEQGFAGVATDVADSRTALSDQLTTTSQNVLGATTDINDLVDKYGKEQTLQFGSLSQGQTGLMSNQGTLQTAFDDYTKQYSDDVQLADQSRSDIGNSVVGGFTDLSNRLGTGFADTQGAIGTVSQGVDGISQGVDKGFATVTSDINDGVSSTTGAIDAVGQDVAGNRASMDTGFGLVARDIASGVAATTAEGQAQQQEFVSNISSMKSYLSDQTLQLEDSVRGDYTSLVTSFDDQGVLITDSIDSNGNTLSRAIDENGNLFIKTSTEQGQVLDQQALNLNTMMADFASFGQSQTQGNADIMAQIGQSEANVQDGFSTRFDVMGDQQATQQRELLGDLSMTRSLLETDVADMDSGLRNQMTALANAYDVNGELITNSIDENGNNLQRQIDAQGNLILSTYSKSTGQLIDQQALDVVNIRNEVRGASVVQGSNATSGYPTPQAGTPAPSSVYSGFSSPYATSI
tara:strand:- start:2757 stop:4658 length:1902 start_codon:yes stop_codon:yes gene_type:complete